MAKKLTVNGSWQQFVTPLEKLEEFKTHGTLFGVPVMFPSQINAGRLPDEYLWRLRSHGVDYVVMSYHTPIAWHDSELGWFMPDERYSVTTSKQQGRIRTAIDYLNNMVVGQS
jgi:hypothetical protein